MLRWAYVNWTDLRGMGKREGWDIYEIDGGDLVAICYSCLVDNAMGTFEDDETGQIVERNRINARAHVDQILEGALSETIRRETWGMSPEQIAAHQQAQAQWAPVNYAE